MGCQISDFCSGFTVFADPNDPENDFMPIPEIRVKGADLTLLNLENNVLYLNKVTDPWYRAENASDGVFGKQWSASEDMSVMAYLEQYQFCSQGRCTELTGLNKLGPNSTGSWGLNSNQQETYNTLWKAAWGIKVQFSAFLLGYETLLAQEYRWGANQLTSSALPADQWITEISNLHNVSLAMLQRRIVEHASPAQAMPSTGINSTSFIVPANTTEAMELCTRQRVYDTAYSSFSVAGLVSVIVVALAIIIVNLMIDRVVAFLQVRFHVGEAKELAWIEAGLLQLQRLAFEGRGIGPWAGLDADVPVTTTHAQRFRASDMYESRGDVDLSLLSTTQGAASKGSPQAYSRVKSTLDTEPSHSTTQ